MKFEAKKEYLRSYNKVMNEIAALQNEYERWETIGTKVTPTLSAAPGGHGDNQSKVERAAIEMERLQREMAKEINNAVKYRQKIIHDINHRSPKVRHAQMLMWRFVNGMTVEQIAGMLKRDERTVRTLINKAINSLDI